MNYDEDILSSLLCCTGNGTDLYNIKKLLEIVAKNSKDLISVSDAEGRYLFVSPSSQKIIGYSSDELVGKKREDYICPEDYQKIKAKLETDEAHGMNTFKFRFKHKDGNLIWLESNITILNEKGSTEPKKFLSISRDITKRVETEEMLRESERRHRLLVEQSPNAVIIYQRDKWVYVNQTGVKLLGASNKNQIIGKKPSGFIHPDYHQLFEQQKIEVENGNTVNFAEGKWIRIDGEIIDVEIKAIPILYDGKPAIHIVITDISEQKKIFEIAQKTEKILLVGQLASGMAHEIRNPLTSIKGFIHLIKDDISNPKYIDIMLTEINQIEQITSELLVLTRSNISQYSPIVLQPLLTQVITLLNSQAILNNVEIIKIFDDKPIVINGNVNQIKQLFINIIKNAIEATSSGGVIKVDLSSDIDNAIIKIIDNGTGMSMDDIKKIGEPFYTTKEKGTGLGMMISYKIIEDHNGTIYVESTLNEGTTFEINIPLC